MRDNKRMRLKPILAIPALVIGLSTFGGACLAIPASAAENRHITISATGASSIVPDAVRINATVSVLDTSSSAALSTANTISSAVRISLTANKITAKDIATQSISVYPEFSYPATGTPTLSGHRASQSFDIVIRASKTAGAVLDSIVAAGQDYLVINSVNPFILDDNKVTDLARTSAVRKAKIKAASYAKMFGVKLGRVIYLVESPNSSSYPIYSTTAKADSGSIVDLGEQKVTVSVTVRWEISYLNR
jgi:uncharacterized protein YggE